MSQCLLYYIKIILVKVVFCLHYGIWLDWMFNVSWSWMSLYASALHHQKFGFLHFVRITKIICAQWRYCMCACVWYRIRCHSFLLGMSVSLFKSTLKRAQTKGREGMIIRNEGSGWDRYFEWQAEMNGCIRRREDWIADTVTLQRYRRKNGEMMEIKDESEE